jgi:hypothetical protein
MNRAILLLMLVLSLAPVLCWAAEPKVDEAKAIAEIEKLGGKVTRDEKSPGKLVIGVAFSKSKLTNAELEHLASLPHLQSLELDNAQITDAAFANISKVPQLKRLLLINTPITDTGLSHMAHRNKSATLVLTQVVCDAIVRHYDSRRILDV